MNSSVRFLGRKTGSLFFNFRQHLHRSARLCTKESENVHDLRLMINPNKLEKFILIVAGTYKRFGDIPDRVSQVSMKRAYDLFRARTSALLVIGGGVGLLVMIQIMKTRRKKEIEERGREY